MGGGVVEVTKPFLTSVKTVASCNGFSEKLEDNNKIQNIEHRNSAFAF
jgi:hypothetical protein